jgi:hypothetical protein
LFRDDNFNRGELAGPPEPSFKVLTPEVVLVSAHLQVKGQGLVGGGTLDRDNFRCPSDGYCSVKATDTG